MEELKVRPKEHPEKKEEKKKAEGQKSRSYCSLEHIQNIVAYCMVCTSYVCDSCQIENHYNHEMQLLEAEAMKVFSEYKRVLYEAETMVKQYEKISETQSIDEVLNNITTTISNKFDELIVQIQAMKQKKINELLGQPEIASRITECRSQEESNLQLLKSIQIDASRMMDQIKTDFDGKRYIALFERNTNTEIRQIRERIQDWKRSATVSPLTFKQLGNDLSIEVKVTEEKINSLIKISFLSRPTAQFIYDFDNENNKLLLYDMHKKTTQIICFGSGFHIPFHYSSVILGNKLYFAGGDDDGYRKDTFALSLKNKTFMKLKDLNVERRNHTLVAFHIAKLLYCLGGYNKVQGILNVVEKCDVSTGTWTLIKPLIYQRQWPGACPFNNKAIYCFGGSNLDSVEKLDILNEEKGWELVVITKNGGVWTGCVACCAIQINPISILIFGGCAGKDLGQCMTFNPELRVFESKSNLPVPSLFCQQFPAISGSLIGTTGWRNNLAYIYDCIANKWATVEPAVYRPPDFESN